VLEPIFEADFLEVSYGFRPRRSALDAVAACRERCWRYDWVIDLDIQKFFDSVPHDLVVKAVQAHTTDPWVVLYVKRWLTAPLQHPDGTLAGRDRGTPQGSAISPVLANLFMHYAFDTWITRMFAGVVFERYADDAVIHCASLGQAQQVLAALENRMAECGLRLHPEKTKIVYCRDANRRGNHPHTSFDFLGFTFRARAARSRQGKVFTGFLPAISNNALKKISAQVRSWRIHRRTGRTISDLARAINPIVRGWLQYYGRYYRTALHPLLMRINYYLMRWLRNKHKRLRGFRKAHATWQRITTQYPLLFAHWAWTCQLWR
jgi:group II intron reverse transcriptase/maturase